jgi:hypothetical protein
MAAKECKIRWILLEYNHDKKTLFVSKILLLLSNAPLSGAAQRSNVDEVPGFFDFPRLSDGKEEPANGG